MRQLATPARPGNIMVVDDNPTNLTLLEEMLRRQGYEVRSLPRGRMAIAAAKHEAPDLILLDINMPEMNGYEVCEQLKASDALSGIPVIFLSALDGTEDKVKAFKAGGVDYISKPFQVEEVQARVEAQLALRFARQAEQNLLERTLGGAVGTLWELVQLTSPVLALRTEAIRHIAAVISRLLALPDTWQYDLAARLSLLGCIAVPDDIFERAYAGEEVPDHEAEIFRAHPARAARLLAKIPRLEDVAAMIEAQHNPASARSYPEAVRRGAAMLHLAMALDRKIYRGMPPQEAVAGLRMAGLYDEAMLGVLGSYSPPKVESEVRRLPARDLRSGMVLREDVFSENGRILVLKAGTKLTDVWVERLENFMRAPGPQQLIEVEIPCFASSAVSCHASERLAG